MKTRVGLMLAVVGATAAMASAQGQFSQGSVSYTFSFQEYDTATQLPVVGPNGQISPGESAMIIMTMSYSPANGTPITYSSTLLVGSSGAGTMGGFWNGALNVNGTNSAEGTWSLSGGSGTNRRGIVPPFSTGGGNGVANPTGTTVANVQPAQFGASVDSLSTATGVVAWRGLWTPTSYAARTVNFAGGVASLPGPSASLWAVDNNYSNGFDLPVVGNVPATFGNVNVPVVPSPSSLALLGLGGLVAARRRRS